MALLVASEDVGKGVGGCLRTEAELKDQPKACRGEEEAAGE